VSAYIENLLRYETTPQTFSAMIGNQFFLIIMK